MHEPSDPAGWVEQHGDALFRFAMLRLRSRDVAEEVVQETFLAAWKGRDRFAGRASERTWLTKILRNKIVDFYRRRRREFPVSDLGEDPEIAAELFDDRGKWRHPPAEWEPDPSALLQQSEFLIVLRACLDGLPERQAAVFTLRLMEMRASEAVCKILDVTATNLGVLLHRARLRLRTCLEHNWFATDERRS